MLLTHHPIIKEERNTYTFCQVCSLAMKDGDWYSYGYEFHKEECLMPYYQVLSIKVTDPPPCDCKFWHGVHNECRPQYVAPIIDQKQESGNQCRSNWRNLWGLMKR